MFRNFLYPFFLHAYSLAIHTASLWNPKAKNWIAGRKEQVQKLEAFSAKNKKEKIIWMHCASLGEFEQGRPVLEAFKQREPTAKILLSFFSPSGYTATKNYINADLIFYLPLDKPSRVKFLLDQLNPSLIIWVKYEFWFNFIHEIKKRKIPLLLIAAHFRKSQPFFKWYGKPWRNMFASFTVLFVQQHSDKILLDSIGIKNIIVGGDTRFDRVLQLTKQPALIPEIILKFVQDEICLVAGSTWPEDEWQLVHFTKTHPYIKCILVPHETDEKSIQEVLERFPAALRYSALNNNSDLGSQILIIDTVGLLSRLYHLATITYVGGGFNESGIHNSLEPAVWGKPVVFGPNYDKFNEACEMVERGSAFSTNTPVELENVLSKILQEIKEKGYWENNGLEYIKDNAGATNIVVEYVYKNRLLIN